MSTKSIIAYKKGNNVFYSHCHYDGQPENMTKELSKMIREDIFSMVYTGLIIEINSKGTSYPVPSFAKDNTSKSSRYKQLSDTFDYWFKKNEAFMSSYCMSFKQFESNNLPSHYEEAYVYLYDEKKQEWKYCENLEAEKTNWKVFYVDEKVKMQNIILAEMEQMANSLLENAGVSSFDKITDNSNVSEYDMGALETIVRVGRNCGINIPENISKLEGILLDWELAQ